MDIQRTHRGVTVLYVGTALALMYLTAGCGGDSTKTATATTGTSGGSLVGMQIFPPPGATFVSKATTFRLTWPDASPPPPTFTVALKRYKESSGDVGRTIDTQRTDLTRVGTSFTWDLKRSDGFDLDSAGVYYIEVDAGPEQVLETYIVSSDRSADVPVSTAAAGSTGDLAHTVTVAAP